MATPPAASENEEEEDDEQEIPRVVSQGLQRKSGGQHWLGPANGGVEGRGPSVKYPRIEAASCVKIVHGHGLGGLSKLLQQQEEVIESQADVKALRYALERFPNLRRIHLTPAAHGFLFLPKYQTPMIRQLPYGLNYPLPRGWPTSNCLDAPTADHWHLQQLENKWRGFRIITRVLAEKGRSHSITDIVVDVHHLDTGLTYHIFDGDRPEQACQEYQDLTAILRHPGFRRFDLSILAGLAEFGESWTQTTHVNLRHALSLASLEHFHLRTNVSRGVSGQNRELNSFIHLEKLLPVESWPKLRHFGLSGLVVDSDDLLKLLLKLPPTLRSVELSFLYFNEMEDSYRVLLRKMKEQLDWGLREHRPKVTIGLHFNTVKAGQEIWVCDEVSEYLYGDRERLFGWPDGSGPNQIQQHQGMGVYLDEFDPKYRQPY